MSKLYLIFVLFSLQAVLVKGDCWNTGCQLSSWAVTGCEQYGRVETGRKPCSGGTIYTCCTPSGGSSSSSPPPTTSTSTAPPPLPSSTPPPSGGGCGATQPPTTTPSPPRSSSSSAPPTGGGSWKTGDITYYNLGMTACGQSFTDSDLVAAIAFSYWTTPNPNLDPMCGRQVLVQDPSSGKSVTVRIFDKCGGCKDGDIDLSPAAFSQLRDFGVGRFKGQWKFI